jgi:predicted 2-oxoglutarate/Fe(II)-dependent dioxygenase YbiX
MIIEIPNVLTQDECEEVIQYFEEYPELRRSGDAQERFNGCTMSTDEVRGPLLKTIAALTNRLIIKAAKFYNIEELYLDYQSIAKWDTGQSMEFHADNVTQKREPHYYCHWRDYSSILYLNHDYEGGYTTFKNQNQGQPPMQGTAILFPATFGYTHGVQKVKSGTRYTISSWFTQDRAHCQC